MDNKLQIVNYSESQESEWMSMVGSDAKGLPLVKKDSFAADILRFRKNQKTSLHTHPGDHILFVVKGSGYLIFNQDYFELQEKCCYFVPGNIPHLVGTKDDSMELLTIANAHQPVNSPLRLTILSDE